jgi:hypothetical protein
MRRVCLVDSFNWWVCGFSTSHYAFRHGGGYLKTFKMAWTKYIKGEQEPEADQDVLLVMKRKTVFNDEKPEKERHVGHRTVKNLWIIGGHFGFDMGEILYYQDMEEIPKD